MPGGCRHFNQPAEILCDRYRNIIFILSLDYTAVVPTRAKERGSLVFPQFAVGTVQIRWIFQELTEETLVRVELNFSLYSRFKV